jgi:hypothetical protein
VVLLAFRLSLLFLDRCKFTEVGFHRIANPCAGPLCNQLEEPLLLLAWKGAAFFTSET